MPLSVLPVRRRSGTDRSCTGRCASPTSSQWCPQGRSPLQMRTSASLDLLADQGDVVRHAQQKTDQQRGTAVVPRAVSRGPGLAARTLRLRPVAGEIDIMKGAEVSREDLGEWHWLDCVGLTTGGHAQGDLGPLAIQATDD